MDPQTESVVHETMGSLHIALHTQKCVWGAIPRLAPDPDGVDALMQAADSVHGHIQTAYTLLECLLEIKAQPQS